MASERSQITLFMYYVKKGFYWSCESRRNPSKTYYIHAQALGPVTTFYRKVSGYL